MNAHDQAGFESRDFNSDEFWPGADLTLLGTNRRPAPAFPVHLLGPFWSAWAREAAEAAAAPIDYPAGALLATVGAALANVRWPVAGAGWQEPPLLWVGLVGSPSSGKSPAMEAAFSLIKDAEDRMAAGFETERRDYEGRKVAAEAHREAWKSDTKIAVKEGRAAPGMPNAAVEPEPPVRPRIRVADATTEKLGALAAGLPRGLLLARDELAGWVASFDRYGGSGSDRAFFLEAYGGRSYRVDRMKNPDPINIRHLSIGVLGTTQPDRLSAITGGADDGFAPRVLWVWPEAHPGFRLARKPVDDRPACLAFGRLVDLGLGADTYGHAEPVRLRLDPEAEDAIESFAVSVAAKVEDVTGCMAGALGKARGHALRLATVIEHLWWCGESRRPEPSTITLKAVASGCALMDSYFIPMAERVYGDAALPVVERSAMALARYLRKHNVRTFNARTLGREAGGSLRTSETMDAACNTLVEANLIRLRPREASPRGGRPAKDYIVNPIVHARAAA